MNMNGEKAAGLMMILSPAKTLNLNSFNSELVEVDSTEPSCNTEFTNQLAGILKKKNKKDLKSMLNISDKLTSSVFTVCVILSIY
jgi:cytoplasmic iron level regulating protein YaaA (DUF328/UPF0246 family)